VRAEESYWARRFFLLDPDDEVPLLERRLYKARWSGGVLD
jgi:hypothetical protein